MTDKTRRSSAGSASTLRQLFEDHYWDSFQGDKEIIMKHVDAVLALAPAPAQSVDLTDATRDQIAAIIKEKVDYFLHDEQGPLDAADAILALSTPPQAARPDFCATADSVCHYPACSCARWESTAPQAVWQPIETKPPNHFPVLVYGPYGQLVAFLDVIWKWWAFPAGEDGMLDYVPTHWMPLPSAPLSRPVSTDIENTGEGQS